MNNVRYNRRRAKRRRRQLSEERARAGELKVHLTPSDLAAPDAPATPTLGAPQHRDTEANTPPTQPPCATSDAVSNRSSHVEDTSKSSPA
eukprot:6189832-Pleurochrysis_carterae.AAC.3